MEQLQLKLLSLERSAWKSIHIPEVVKEMWSTLFVGELKSFVESGLNARVMSSQA